MKADTVGIIAIIIMAVGNGVLMSMEYNVALGVLTFTGICGLFRLA